jgi:3-dehydroquinate synthase
MNTDNKSSCDSPGSGTGSRDACDCKGNDVAFIAQTVQTDPPYPVLIGPGLHKALADALPSSLAECKIAVVADDTVARLYGAGVQASLGAAGHAVSLFTFPAGEESKTLQTLEQLLEFLSEQQLDRGDLVLALGGGVTGDLAGFAAAVYLRGIRFVQAPTTLLAAVDSSVGGKTAVNLSRGKNLAGAFWQPVAVICDTDALLTLPDELYAEGIAEAIKCGIIGDPGLFDLLKRPVPRGSGVEAELIRRCVAFKADVVAQDEKEQGLRALLNFGHTVAHAIERCSGYRIRHGQAVARGMAIATRAAETDGFAEKGTTSALQAVLNVHGLDRSGRTVETLNPDDLLEAIGSDKKKRGERITLVLPRRIGACELVSMPMQDAKHFLKKGFEE